MADLVIRDIDPALKAQLEARAKAHGRSLSDEAKALIGESATPPDPATVPDKMGTFLFSLLEPEYRGDDLWFERNDLDRPPPFSDFE
ncbi:hypothetical protein A33M_0268 [Rhodovulum sp. PH10]|uniref:FitA-like ribbon-helix-helix domain-containing protein n=1 Tax=Rhodovulum sp. PH10 TaxID=1187851 RepID=UPI00027C23F7|nr:hypothetical protein [Rhodovulum sp. PH10]EJW10255.1 hypothetical protein A33M_0268 [Rhodovulum sp. PH10]